jgi:hypothetical protein
MQIQIKGGCFSMQNIRNINPVLRATGIIAVVAALVTGITFAALQSQATLTNSTIASATADLQIDNTDNGSGFSNTDTGYAFTGVVPGGADSNTGNFQLKNNSTGGADLSIDVQVPTLPTWTVVPAGPVVNADVDVIISCTGTLGVFGVTTDLVSINAGPVALTGANLDNGDTATCTVKISMDATAFTGTNASSTNFDFVFTGTGV